MLVGHSDEVGFLIRYIDENGFLYFGGIGDVDPLVTQGRKVNLHTRNGIVPGVVGLTRDHLSDSKGNDTSIKMGTCCIDIGVSSKQGATELVRVGDPVTFTESFSRLHGDRVTSRGFDDKAGSFVVAEVLRCVAAAAEKLSVDLYGVSSVQEEIGLRGGTTSAYAIKPDIGICVEFDRIVSIGMFEHVGYKNYRTFMNVADRCLKEGGLFLLHTIGGSRSVTTTDLWIERYIFPNGMLPSAAQITSAIEGRFILEAWHNFGPDYDTTLMAWWRNFEDS